MGGQRRLVVIGGVAGGATAASKARRCCPDAVIEIYDQDRHISYAGCGLPYFLGGLSPNWRKVIAREPQQFKERQYINVHLRHRVEAIDVDNKAISITDLEAGKKFRREYDTLIMATGAVPIMPNVPGKDLEGVFVLRTLSNALEIKSFLDLNPPGKVTIIGAGSIGLDMCEALRRFEIEVDLIEAADHVLPHLEAGMSGHIRQHVEQNGVTVYLGSELRAMEGSNGKVKKVITSGGDIETDMVLVCIGVAPQTELAKQTGIELGAKGAIKVDGYMRTSKQDILACGDCVTTYNYVSGKESWIPLGSTSRKQGRTAGNTFAGTDYPFPGVQATFITKVFDMTAGKTGITSSEAKQSGIEAEDLFLSDYSIPRYFPGGGEIKACVTFEKSSGRLLGAEVVGDLAAGVDKRLDVFVVAIKAGLTANEMSNLDLAYSPPYSHPLDLPILAGNLGESKILGKTCSCNSTGLE
ncbi:MAG: hypothetical protein A2V52_07260 [Actinobacteria bacterium RBG_19FT_COMBO_54_7]|uniref:Pyridine nucleotide-disulfide oxidoreductase n=1 Tax=Candidatus Solincola sediminis TaxID=1797199 RepID=A0A1F2WFB5_9ACTN|nr:MAG: hypothetical protein A2Y75_09400 [Candidatus Solincola sediminis]OFW57794.1 MAG: hypothetical protein A2W01_05085 [Candidatus Solincola sediminis]OFW68792.1 MAG: hypothetical protein A2V52_07260 [Actinobacteria bacterium RBG_19FT_COMBO_54_7]